VLIAIGVAIIGTRGDSTPAAAAPSTGSQAPGGSMATPSPPAQESTGPSTDVSASNGSSPAVSPSATSTKAPPVDLATASPQPTGSATPLAPIDPTATATPAAGLTVSLGALAAVQGVAQGPGEIAGPAVRVPVRISNATDEGLDLATVVVDVSYGKDRTPASTLSKGGSPLAAQGTLAAGRSAEGVYLFSVPKAEQDELRVVVHYDVRLPDAVFTGGVG